MRIPPIYTLSQTHISLLSSIEALRLYFQSLEIKQPILNKILTLNTLRSAVYSARIEGNTLLPEEIEVSSNQNEQKEITNVIKAYQYIDSNSTNSRDITTQLLLDLQGLVMNGSIAKKGAFRNHMEGIFNANGDLVYMPPAPTEVNLLISQMLNYTNASTEQFILVRAFISHLLFEKIHPFTDGNGRVGRLLVYALLQKNKFSFGMPITFEEYLDTHKNDYYQVLDRGLSNVEYYLEFMLKAFLWAVQETKVKIEDEMNKKNILILPPRQEELYLIIKDHKQVNFDFLHRRFMKIPERTLRYDLLILANKKLIIKVGKTRGSLYRINGNS